MTSLYPTSKDNGGGGNPYTATTSPPNNVNGINHKTRISFWSIRIYTSMTSTVHRVRHGFKVQAPKRCNNINLEYEDIFLKK